MKYILDTTNLSLLCFIKKMKQFFFQCYFEFTVLPNEFLLFFKGHAPLIQRLDTKKILAAKGLEVLVFVKKRLDC